MAATVPAHSARQPRFTPAPPLAWTRGYVAEVAALVCPPGLCGQAADPASIAGSVVEAVTRAMSLLRPPGARGAGHG